MLSSTEVFVNMLSQKLFAIALLFSTVYGSPTFETRIYGGQEAKPGQFPHHISLRSGSFYQCGGALLSSRFALTAAHCVWQSINDTEDYLVVVGAHEKHGNEGRAHRVARFIPHEEYSQPINIHDIALIEVKTPIDFNERVAPISLHREFIKAGIKAVSSGWGKTNVIYKDIPQQVLFRPSSYLLILVFVYF